MTIIDITSIGKASSELQQPPAIIARTAEALEITPHRINGVAHYSAEMLERIADRLRQPTNTPTGA